MRNSEDTKQAAKLEQALADNDTTAMRTLLQNGADPDTLAAHWPPRTTLLYVAMIGDLREAFALLLQSGANPSLPQMGGISIQDMCLSNDNPQRAWACSLVNARERQHAK